MWVCQMYLSSLSYSVTRWWKGLSHRPHAEELEEGKVAGQHSTMFEVWSPRRIRGAPGYVAAADGNCSPHGTSQVALVVKNPLSNAEDVRHVDSIPGAGRSPGERNGNSLQYSCPGSPMDRGAGQATVRGVAESQTQVKQLSTNAKHVIRKVAQCQVEHFITGPF